MEISGEHVFDAPRERVWTLIRDPDTVERLIPGLRRLDPVDDTEYEGELKIGTSFLSVTYHVTLRVVGERPPARLELEALGTGRPGDVEGAIAIDLAEAGEARTAMRYDMTFALGGRASRVAEKAKGIAETKIAEGIAALDEMLDG